MDRHGHIRFDRAEVVLPMIPTLHAKDALKLTDLGLGFLTDIISATVTEERNGKYEMTFRYPVSGIHFDEIDTGSLVCAKPSPSRDPQAFRVYKASRPINGIVTFSCQHISYDLCGFPLAGFSCEGLTPQQAISKAISETPISSAAIFSAQSNIASTNSTSIDEPCSVRGLLAGRAGSILDVWGGEFEFYNRTVRLWSARGTDSGVTILYGKNMTDVVQDSDVTDTYTHVLPYASYTVEGDPAAEPVYVTLPEKVLTLGVASTALLGVYRAMLKDFSDQFGETEEPTVEKLRTKATAWAQGSGYGYSLPRATIKVSFLPLGSTLEYASLAALEQVDLCDIVTVRYAALGVNAKTKVVKTVYDCLADRYESITLGDLKKSFASMYVEDRTIMRDIRQGMEHPILTEGEF